jgi:DNA-binding LacI/PurR family transcriptional regulator
MPGISATLDLFESKVLGALEAELIQNGTPVLLSSVSVEQMEAGELPDIVSQGYVDTLVCLLLEYPNYVELLRRQVKDLIHIGPTAASVNRLDFDNRAGSQIAARHLYSLGHREIVVVHPKEIVHGHIERKEAFVAEFTALAGAECRIRFVQCSVWTNQLAEAAVEQMLYPKKPDAVFCANDFLALQILQSLKQRGLDVPKDISVMGFDNMELAELANPPLTTIDTDKLAIGKQAAEFALRLMRKPDRTRCRSCILPVRLIERTSTARKSPTAVLPTSVLPPSLRRYEQG